MKTLLSALVMMLIATQTLSIDASLAPGLSLKNAMLYAAAIAVMARMVISGSFRPQLAGLQACFLFLIGYAVLSWLVVAFAIRYPGYDVVQSAIILKNGLVDYAVFFVVFFYGLQSLEDALSVTNAFLVGVVIANLITVLDASGVLGWNIISVRTFDAMEVGRVQGAFGEANQHAAVIAMLLPAMCAKVVLSKGLSRILWLSSIGFAVAVLFMTASRGAMLGLVLASVWGGIVFRRYISIGSVALWAGAAVLMVAVVLLAVSDTYFDLVKERVVGLTLSGDVTEASSGRNAIWGDILGRMIASPWSFLTGFGWDAYSVMEFEYAPHNTYLGIWFNLGVPGLLAFVLVLLQAIGWGRRAADAAPPELRPLFMAFAVGFFALCVSIFFVELHIPWLYVWAYVGLMMRAAASMLASRDEDTVAVAAPSSPAPVQDPARRLLTRQRREPVSPRRGTSSASR